MSVGKRSQKFPGCAVNERLEHPCPFIPQALFRRDLVEAVRGVVVVGPLREPLPACAEGAGFHVRARRCSQRQEARETENHAAPARRFMHTPLADSFANPRDKTPGTSSALCTTTSLWIHRLVPVRQLQTHDSIDGGEVVYGDFRAAHHGSPAARVRRGVEFHGLRPILTRHSYAPAWRTDRGPVSRPCSSSASPL